MIESILLFAGLALGALGAWLVLRNQAATARTELIQLRERLTGQQAQLAETQARVAEERTRAEQLNGDLRRQAADFSGLQATLEAERTQAAEKLALLQKAGEELTVQFQNVANKIFDEKSKRFAEQNQTNLDLILKPLGERIKEFQTKVEEKFSTEGKERASLKTQVEMLHELNKKISEEASNLAAALKGSVKAQGNWGEMLLEKILERSGLRKDSEYKMQVYKTDGNDKFYLDALIELPEDRCLIIDSKVSLIAYERYCAAETVEDQKAAVAALTLSVRQHVDGLAKKSYPALLEGRSPDLVLMFIPIEPVFHLAAQNDPELFVYAYDKMIMPVGPSTLLATLKTVATIWQYERQNRNVQVIAKEAGKMYEEFVTFAAEFKTVETAIQGTQRAYDQAFKRLTHGRGNLTKRAYDLQRLGAAGPKGKVLPENLVQLAIEAPDDDLPPEPT